MAFSHLVSQLSRHAIYLQISSSKNSYSLFSALCMPLSPIYNPICQKHTLWHRQLMLILQYNILIVNKFDFPTHYSSILTHMCNLHLEKSRFLWIQPHSPTSSILNPMYPNYSSVSSRYNPSWSKSPIYNPIFQRHTIWHRQLMLLLQHILIGNKFKLPTYYFSIHTHESNLHPRLPTSPIYNVMTPRYNSLSYNPAQSKSVGPRTKMRESNSEE